MENELSIIREIMIELQILGEPGDYYFLPEKLEVEFKKVNDAILEIWTNKPENIDDLVLFNLVETANLMSMMSSYDVNHGNVANFVGGEVGFRREIKTCICNGLSQVFSQLRAFRNGADPINLSLRSYSV